MLVSADKLCESYGIRPEWNEKSGVFIGRKGDTQSRFTIGEKAALLNGKQVVLRAAPVKIYGEPFVPLQETSDAFGGHIVRFRGEQAIHLFAPKPLLPSYDVVVIGSEPEAIAAAVASAREGQRTLLVDKKPRLGGLYTLGRLNTLDMNYTPSGGILVTKGLFEEFFNGIGRSSSFDTDQAQSLFDTMAYREKNLTIALSANRVAPLKSENKITAVSYTDAAGASRVISGKQFIDSTQDADFAAAAGVPFTLGQQDYRRVQTMMCVTLLFEVSGVNWDELRSYLKSDGDSASGSDGYSAWGFGSEMERYRSSDPSIRMRGLNMGRQFNGNALINALQILDMNALNPDERRAAWEKGKAEVPRVIQYMKHMPGLSNVKLVSVAPELYVRETRHMVGQYRVTLDDVLENRDFPDKIAFGSYPVDVQRSPDQPGMVIGDPALYSIPFRALTPKQYTNLLVASRSASYDSLAHGSIRVVPVGMAVGQAAGIASAYANTHHVDFHMITNAKDGSHIKEIQRLLVARQAYLRPILSFPDPFTLHWAYPGVAFLRKYAIIEGGYMNDYKLDEERSRQAFAMYVTRAAERSGTALSFTYPYPVADSSAVTKDDVLRFLNVNHVSVDSLSLQTKYHLEHATKMSADILYMVVYDIFHMQAHKEDLIKKQPPSAFGERRPL
nr:FAD-dependent oxidoreductase [Aneurinibacillus tyrosinisolvens]